MNEIYRSNEVGAGDKISELRALKSLAPTSARVILEKDDGKCGDALVFKNGDVSSKRNNEIQRELWERMVQSGWVVFENINSNEAWRISNAGRLRLKRLLSRSNAELESKARHHREEGRLPQPTKTGREHCRPGGVNNFPKTCEANAVQFNESESPLAWLRRRRSAKGTAYLDDFEFLAGERLRKDFWFAQMTPNVTANWSQVRTGHNGRRSGLRFDTRDKTDAISDAGERVRAALKAVGPELSGILFDVCCHLKGLEGVEKDRNWPRRSGKAILKLALQALARHYKLDGIKAKGSF